MKKDFFIRLLEYGERHPKGFNLKQVTSDKRLKLNDWEKRLVEKYIENSCKNETMYGAGGFPNLETPFLAVQRLGKYHEDNNKFIISLDSRFKYIDYLELKEARQSAQKANKNAIIAISIAIVTLLISIIFSIIQIVKPVELDKIQFKEVKNLKFEPSSTNTKLDNLIKKQEDIIKTIENLEIDVAIE